jgi:hypothetical protein
MEIFEIFLYLIPILSVLKLNDAQKNGDVSTNARNIMCVKCDYIHVFKNFRFQENVQKRSYAESVHVVEELTIKSFPQLYNNLLMLTGGVLKLV